MYFFKKGGRQLLDLRGDLILTHNDALVKSRVKSAAPRAVRNALYVLDIPSLGFWRKLRVTFAAIRFIWGRSRALKPETIEEEGALTMDLTREEKTLLLAALDLYEGDENTSIPDSAACADLEEKIREA